MHARICQHRDYDLFISLNEIPTKLNKREKQLEITRPRGNRCSILLSSSILYEVLQGQVASATLNIYPKWNR